MESFDNFQFESGSTYGGLPIVDDTSSIVSGYTGSIGDSRNNLPQDLESLSGLSFSSHAGDDHNNDQAIAKVSAIEEDFDGVLDDLKDESAVELPPHACRFVRTPLACQSADDFCIVIAVFIHLLRWSNV